MDAKELRLGNLIFDEYGKPTPVTTLLDGNANAFYVENNWTLVNAHTEGHDNEWKLEKCFPIPLTEEWLIKFGFYCSSNPMSKYSKDFEVDLGHASLSAYINLSFDITTNTPNTPIFQLCAGDRVDMPHDMEIEHVHTLQNLFFALTGKELTIKE